MHKKSRVTYTLSRNTFSIIKLVCDIIYSYFEHSRAFGRTALIQNLITLQCTKKVHSPAGNVCFIPIQGLQY